MVEQSFHNRKVEGSNPSFANFILDSSEVERVAVNYYVGGSIPSQGDNNLNHVTIRLFLTNKYLQKSMLDLNYILL